MPKTERGKWNKVLTGDGRRRPLKKEGDNIEKSMQDMYESITNQD